MMDDASSRSMTVKGIIMSSLGNVHLKNVQGLHANIHASMTITAILYISDYKNRKESSYKTSKLTLRYTHP